LLNLKHKKREIVTISLFYFNIYCMIKKYKEFREAFNIYQTDEPEIAADKNQSNDAEKDIKEFLTKKVTIDNIYNTYKDEKDLISKLFAQKFIEANTSDKKRIKFNNPLIALYAMAADKKRELKSLQDDLQTKTDTLSNVKSSMSDNPDNKDSLTNDINYNQDKITELNDKIKKLNTEIMTLSRNADQKLKQMKADILNNKKRLDYFIKNK